MGDHRLDFDLWSYLLFPRGINTMLCMVDSVVKKWGGDPPPPHGRNLPCGGGGDAPCSLPQENPIWGSPGRENNAVPAAARLLLLQGDALQQGQRTAMLTVHIIIQ